MNLNNVIGNLNYYSTAEAAGSLKQLTLSSDSKGNNFSLIQLAASNPSTINLAAGSSVTLSANFSQLGSIQSEAKSNIIRASAMQISGNSAVKALGSLSIETAVTGVYGIQSGGDAQPPNSLSFPLFYGLVMGDPNPSQGVGKASNSSLTGETGSLLSVKATATPTSTTGPTVTVVGAFINGNSNLTWQGDVEITSEVTSPNPNGLNPKMYTIARGIDANAALGDVNVSLNAGINTYDTNIKVSNIQEEAYGLSLIVSNTDYSNKVNIGGQNLNIEVQTFLSMAGIADDLDNSHLMAQATGISLYGGELDITSENINIKVNSVGNEKGVSSATGINVGLNSATAKINIGAENTKQINISATSSVTGAIGTSENKVIARGVHVGQGSTVNIGNKDSYTDISANLIGTPENNQWYGNIAGVSINGTNGNANVNLYGEGTIAVNANIPEGFKNATSYSIRMVGGQTAKASELAVNGSWDAIGNVMIGQGGDTGSSTLSVNDGSLSVTGNLTTAVANNSSVKLTGSSLDVSGTVANAGNFTVGENSTAAVNGSDSTPAQGTPTYSFSNSGTLTVNGDLSVAGTLQNTKTDGGATVTVGTAEAPGTLTAGAIINGSNGDSSDTSSTLTLTEGTLNVGNVTNYAGFTTSGGTTLVVTGNATESTKAIEVNGNLVTDTSNFFGENGNLLTSPVFTVSGAQNVTLEGSLTPEQITQLTQSQSGLSTDKLSLTEGVDFTGSTQYNTPFAQQGYYQSTGLGSAEFAYKQANTRNPAVAGSTVKTNLVVGTAPTGNPDFPPPVNGTTQYDQWTNGMGVGSIDLGTGDQIYVNGKTLQIAGLGNTLVTNDAKAATLTVQGPISAGDLGLIIGGTGGSDAAAPNLTVKVVSGGTMSVQGDLYANKSLNYSIGTVNLGNAYQSGTPAVSGTSGNLTINNASLSVNTLNVYVATSNGTSTSASTKTGQSNITVTNGTLTVTNPVQIQGLSAISGPDGGTPVNIALDNGNLTAQAGFGASYTTITGTGDSNVNVGNAELSLQNSSINLANGNITAGTTSLSSAPISITGEGSVTLGNTTLKNSNITVANGDLTMGTLVAEGTSSTAPVVITVENGNLTTGNATIGNNVEVDVGATSAVSMGATTLTGSLTIEGATEGATTLAPVTLVSLAFNEDSGTFAVGPQVAVQIGAGNLETAASQLRAAFPGTTFTNILSTDSTINLSQDNVFSVGTDLQATTPTRLATSGVELAGTTGVAVNLQTLSGNTLFAAGEGDDLPVIISAQTSFVIINPVGNQNYFIVNEGFATEGLPSLSNQQIKTNNPLYTVLWVPDQDPTTTPADQLTYTSTEFMVRLNPVAVRDNLDTVGINTAIDAANFPYGTNQGADTIMRILSGVTNNPASYAAASNAINRLALIGAAAHAHETGILATSMVVDSIWEHGNKLAAAPHEEAKGDIWITFDWMHSRANDYKAAGLDNGYKMDLYGATFGADYDFANGLAAGLAVSVGGGETKAKGFDAGQKTDVTYWGINLYGVYSGPIVNVIGNVGYIGVKNKTKVGGDKGRPDANIWTIGVKAEKDFPINEQFTVTPHVGIRYLSVDVDDFNLGGFHYGTDKANLVQFPFGVAFAANLKTEGGAKVKPFLDLSIVPTAGDRKVDNTFGIQGGNASDTIDTTVASTMLFQGKLGVNANYGAHNFGLNFTIGGGTKGRLDTGLQAKYRFVF